MSRFLILCCAVLAEVFVVLATGSKTEPTMSSIVNAPCSSPLAQNGRPSIAESPMIRKLGKHGHEQAIKISPPAQAPSDIDVDNEQRSSTEEANPPSTDPESTGVSEMTKIQLVNKHHRNVDKSIAGGGVILGGLATIFLVAVFRYIRATRRKSIEPSA